jgi:methionyl-tRNA formyltransferase
MRLVFMGTPDFALPALQMLSTSSHEIVGVYSQAPKPKGRGHQVQKSPVHQFAEEKGYHVFTPSSLRSKEVQDTFRSLNVDLAIVVAYGLLLPREILHTPKHGCLNIHGSLLPRWRGAAPIHRAIMAGDRVTGVTIMAMEEGLDTGPMISQIEVPIHKDSTTEDLHHILSTLGTQLLEEVLRDYPCPWVEQPLEGVTYAHKLKKEEAFLDLSWDATTLERHVRALNPWPGAFLVYEGLPLKILKAQVVAQNHAECPGQILDDRFLIACGKDALRPMILQKPGKKPVSLKDFLNGVSVAKGSHLDLRRAHDSL